MDEVVVARRDAADVDCLPLFGGDVDVAPADSDAFEEAQRTRPVSSAVAAFDRSGRRRAERRQRRAVVARQAETTLVIAEDLDTVQGPQLVTLERLQVPMAVRRVDVVAQSPDSDHALKTARSQRDQLIRAHRGHAPACTAALHEQRPVADVLDARGEDGQWMVLRWPAPANGARQRRTLIEIGQEEMRQTAGGASRASARAQEHRNDAKPNPHASVSTRLQEVEHAIIHEARIQYSTGGCRFESCRPCWPGQAETRWLRRVFGASGLLWAFPLEPLEIAGICPHGRATGAGCYSRRT